jgi:hypothetical protein
MTAYVYSPPGPISHVHDSNPFIDAYMYIYIYIYKCIYLCIYICMYIYTSLCIFIYTYKYIRTNVCKYIHTCIPDNIVTLPHEYTYKYMSFLPAH